MEYGIYFAFWFFLMLSLMNKCYRIYIACILFINMRYAFGMLLLKHPVLYIYIKVEISIYQIITGVHKPTTTIIYSKIHPDNTAKRCNRKTKFFQVSLEIYKLTLQNESTKPNHPTTGSLND